MVANGVHEGKVIPIPRLPFLIGRSGDCHLKPSSLEVSERHCALRRRDEQVFVCDLNSKNGTFVNTRPVTEEIQLCDGDSLQVGPLVFRVKVAPGTPPRRGRSKPPRKTAPQPADEESIAAFLLGEEEEVAAEEPDEEREPTEAREEVVEGSVPPPPASGPQAPNPARMPPWPEPPSGDTSSVASGILRRYQRPQHERRRRGPGEPSR